MLDHTWRYFELHANQRMYIFNFFLVLSGLVAAGLAASFEGKGPLLLIGVVLGLLLALVSFVFWKLDQRVSFLIKNAEIALVELEALFPELRLRLFTEEPRLTQEARSAASLLRRQWTYGHSFRFVFSIMGGVGLLFTILSISRYTGWIKW